MNEIKKQNKQKKKQKKQKNKQRRIQKKAEKEAKKETKKAEKEAAKKEKCKTVKPTTDLESNLQNYKECKEAFTAFPKHLGILKEYTEKQKQLTKLDKSVKGKLAKFKGKLKDKITQGAEAVSKMDKGAAKKIFGRKNAKKLEKAILDQNQSGTRSSKTCKKINNLKYIKYTKKI